MAPRPVLQLLYHLEKRSRSKLRLEVTPLIFSVLGVLHLHLVRNALGGVVLGDALRGDRLRFALAFFFFSGEQAEMISL